MLFKDSIKLKEYSELTAAVNFISLKSTINHVEEKHIIQILGKELYAVLNNAYTSAVNEAALSEPLQKLLDRTRKVIGPYLAYYYAPKADVKLSDAGMQRLETANNKTSFQYQGDNFRKANLLEAEEQSELLLEFLEENKDDYSDWTGSKAFEKYRSLFIKTGGEFDHYFPSHSPYRNYWAMRSKMVQVQDLYIKKAIGAELYTTLKEKALDPDGTFTDEETELLEKLKYAIANFTVSMSIPYLSIRMDANGINISDTGSSTSNDQLSKQKSASENQLSLIIKSAASTGQEWLDDAIQYIKDNAAAFGDWDEETDTTEVKGDTAIRDINEGLAGSFVL